MKEVTKEVIINLALTAVWGFCVWFMSTPFLKILCAINVGMYFQSALSAVKIHRIRKAYEDLESFSALEQEFRQKMYEPEPAEEQREQPAPDVNGAVGPNDYVDPKKRN